MKIAARHRCGRRSGAKHTNRNGPAERVKPPGRAAPAWAPSAAPAPDHPHLADEPAPSRGVRLFRRCGKPCLPHAGKPPARSQGRAPRRKSAPAVARCGLPLRAPGTLGNRQPRRPAGPIAALGEYRPPQPAHRQPSRAPPRHRVRPADPKTSGPVPANGSCGGSRCGSAPDVRTQDGGSGRTWNPTSGDRQCRWEPGSRGVWTQTFTVRSPACWKCRVRSKRSPSFSGCRKPTSIR